MGDEMPDGTVQGYFSICKKCGAEIKCNVQGGHSHNCKKKPEKPCAQEPNFGMGDTGYTGNIKSAL